MVGPVRGPEHLDIIHRLRFYHVPISSIAASRTGVSYIAFYEGASRFGGKLGAIREYAPVLRVSRVLRKELPGLTWPGRRGEGAPYYRFDLGALATLPQPITNPERIRVAFLFPRIVQFHRAKTLRDLGTGQRARGLYALRPVRCALLEEGRAMRLTKAEREFAAYQRVCRVATVGKDGLPHNVPVCPIIVNDRIYFASEVTATKVRNIQATGQAAVTFDEYTEAWAGLKGVLLRGSGKIIDRGPAFRRIRKLLYQRYPQYEEYAALEEKEAAIVEVTPTRKFSWGL